MPVRRPLPSPVVVPRSTYYSTSARHDYGIDDSINQAEYFSNAVLDDTYESARQSKNRDNELIRNTRAAIVSTEQHVSPRAASVSRRVRASTAPPVPRPVQPVVVASTASTTKVASEAIQRPPPAPRPRVVLLPSSPRVFSANTATTSKPVVLVRGGSVPPADFGASRGARAASLPPRAVGKKSHAPAPPSPKALPTSSLRAHRPPQVPFRGRASSVGPSSGAYQPSSVLDDSGRPSTAHLYAHRPLVLTRGRASSVGPSSGAYQSSSGLEDSGRPSSVHLYAHRPLVLTRDAKRQAKPVPYTASTRLRRAVSEPRALDKASDYYYSIPQVRERALGRYLYAERGRGASAAKPKRFSLGDFPQVYVPKKGPGPSNRAKAAIIGSRMETQEAAGKPPRRPRSQFASNKLREFKIQDIERKYK